MVGFAIENIFSFCSVVLVRRIANCPNASIDCRYFLNLFFSSLSLSLSKKETKSQVKLPSHIP